MRDWIIRKLGGVTKAEHRSFRDDWDRSIAALKAVDKVTLIEGPAYLQNVNFEGPLVINPESGATLIGCQFHS